MNDYILRIDSVNATLDNIEIKGRRNIERMLACMQALDTLKEDISKEAAERASENEQGK